MGRSVSRHCSCRRARSSGARTSKLSTRSAKRVTQRTRLVVAMHHQHDHGSPCDHDAPRRRTVCTDVRQTPDTSAITLCACTPWSRFPGCLLVCCATPVPVPVPVVQCCLLASLVSLLCEKC